MSFNLELLREELSKYCTIIDCEVYHETNLEIKVKNLTGRQATYERIENDFILPIYFKEGWFYLFYLCRRKWALRKIFCIFNHVTAVKPKTPKIGYATWPSVAAKKYMFAKIIATLLLQICTRLFVYRDRRRIFKGLAIFRMACPIHNALTVGAGEGRRP